MDNVAIENIRLFKELFKGREEVFAIRWERDGKSGYMPAYDLNWDEFAKFKANGGRLKDFPHKTYSKLSEQRIINHLSGKEVIGIYPLLADNSSWFIAADFDESLSSKRSWADECRMFAEACQKYNLHAYFERSRSGNGGHVWIFFATNYPAFKSRRIALHILETAGIISPFDKNSNYDRLFPNQDSHSGKGLGNLIALPLQKKAMDSDNSCFIDPASLIPFPDQWDFLGNVKKVSNQQLDEIFNSITNPSPENIPLSASNTIQITLSNQVEIPRHQLSPDLIGFLRDNLNFINSDYIIKKKLGKNTFGIESYFRMLEEKDGFVFMPRGFIGKLIRYCKEKNISYQLIDKRKKLTEVNFSFKGSLYDYQQKAIDVASKKDVGIIVAPPGSGKTIMGLAIIAQRKQPALIIVHRKQLFDQWIERIQSFLGIAEPFIGKIMQGHQKIGTHITVAMIQSIAALDNADSLFNSFGMIIIDECHHVPAKTFRQVIKSFASYYLYGLTATPIRKNNDEKLIFIHIGDVIHEVAFPKENKDFKKVSVIIRETDMLVPFDFKTDQFEILSKILIHDSARTKLIIEDIEREVRAGKKVLVLTERKAHIDVLHQYLKNKFEIITISGEDPEASRKTKLKQISDGQFQIIISTGQFLGEGTDIDNLDCLILAYPFAFEGKLVQYIGRVQRAEITPVIYDYRDIHIDYLEKLFRQRSKYYQKLLHSGQLQKFDELTLIFNDDRVTINSDENTLPVSCIDLPIDIEKFREGIAWKLRVLNYNDETGELMTEILDYYAKPEIFISKQGSFQFQVIDKIKFRAIDTGKLLNAVELKKTILISGPAISTEPIISYDEPPKPIEKIIPKPIERVLKKTIKVSFDKIQFLPACVSFHIFIEELGEEIKFEIDNPDIRPEFEAIKDYFARVLKKKFIVVDIEIRYMDNQILSKTAKSVDIDSINSSIIDSIRFEFVKREILSFKGNKEGTSVLNTLNNLVANDNIKAQQLFKSDQDLIDDILSIKDSKHYHQLKYLSSQHLSSILKMRFVLNPFSFLFLLAGEKKYHIVWETLNSEEATYIWHFEKSMDELRKGLIEIEQALTEIKATSKQQYLKKDHPHFSRVIHDYSDVKKGFTEWKGLLEEKLV